MKHHLAWLGLAAAAGFCIAFSMVALRWETRTVAMIAALILWDSARDYRKP